MARQSRTHGRHAFLPSGMTAFLRRRAGQLMGFVLVSLAVALTAILGTYHASDPSWNLAIEGPVKNILAFPGAVLADLILQTFGVAAAFWVIAFLGWGIRSMAAVPLRWAPFRVVALGLSTLLAASVAAQWASPKAWLLPNSLGGALGELLLHKAHDIVGTSRLSFFGIVIFFSCLSLILLLWVCPLNNSVCFPLNRVTQIFSSRLTLSFESIKDSLRRSVDYSNPSSPKGAGT